MSTTSQFFSGGPQVWVSGTTYVIGNILLSPADNYQQYVRITNGAGTTDPSSDSTNYRPYGGRAIKSVQRGTISIGSGSSSATATVTSVNTAKTKLFFGGCSTTAGSGATDSALAGVTLTNATTVTATRGASAATTIVYWALEESY